MTAIAEEGGGNHDTLHDLRNSQLSDLVLGEILRRVEDGLPRPGRNLITAKGMEYKIYWGQWEGLIVKDGILYRMFEEDRGHSYYLQAFIPKTLRVPLMKELHNHKTSGYIRLVKE